MSDETKPDLPATTKDLVDSALNFGTNLLTTLDLPASVVKNVYKALGRLSSAAIEVPIAFLEGKAAEIRAKSEGLVKIVAEGTDQIIQQMEVPSEYVQVAVNKYVGKIIGEQLNLDNISAIAANELNKDESNNSSDQNAGESDEQQSTNSTNQDANSSEEKTINDVWLNIFETEARPQSTEEGQLLFGRILAGEIRNPGSYSIRTVKTLGELDRDIASLFKNLCSVSVVLEDLNSNYIFDVRVPSLGGDPGFNVLDKYGLSYRELNSLHEYGLIIQEYDSVFSYGIHTVTKDDSIPQRFRHQERYWNLLPSPEWDSDQELFDLSGVVFSHVGYELLSIVDQDPVPEYTADLKKYFEEQNLNMLEVNSP